MVGAVGGEHIVVDPASSVDAVANQEGTLSNRLLSSSTSSSSAFKVSPVAKVAN